MVYYELFRAFVAFVLSIRTFAVLAVKDPLVSKVMNQIEAKALHEKSA